MTYWDFMGMSGNAGLGASDALAALQGVRTPTVDMPNQPVTMWDKIMGAGENFFSDPNNIRTMAQLGSALSQGQPFGQAAGNAADLNERRKAMQAAGAKTGENQQNLLQQLIQAIVGDDPRKLVGDKEDRTTFDSLTIGPDGGFTLKAPGNKKPRIQGAQESLESIQSVEPPSSPFL